MYYCEEGLWEWMVSRERESAVFFIKSSYVAFVGNFLFEVM